MPTKKAFQSSIHPPAKMTEPGLWFVFKQDEILIQTMNDVAQIPELLILDSLELDIVHQNYLGIYAGRHCFAVEVSAFGELPQNIAFQPLRKSHEQLADDDLFLLVTRAKQILNWDKTTQFCGVCGHKTENSEQERAKICPQCQQIIYPQISPVILVRINRGDEILLAHSPNFPDGIYSILAGFVEPGETIEQAIAREVFEEVRLEVKNITYVASQPWPFPSNLMLGFTAEYKAGEIIKDGVEIQDANWFRCDNLPALPRPISLSRWLIDDFCRLHHR